MVNPHMGSNLDDFLAEEGILDDVEAIALKRVMAYQFNEAMKQKRYSKKKLAEKLNTSRASLDRLLDPQNTAVTLKTIVKAANALGCKVNISVAPA